MDSESFCGEGVQGWLKPEEGSRRKIPQHPSSNPKHKAILEEPETCDALKINHKINPVNSKSTRSTQFHILVV